MALKSPVVASAFTPDNNVTVTRIQAQAMLPPSGCTSNLALQVSDGSPAGAITLPVTASANDTGPLAVNYAAGTSLTLTVVPGSGCTIPAASINVVVQYQGR